MLCFFDDRQLGHAPEFELHNGTFKPYAEHPGRVTSIRRSLGALQAVGDQGMDPIAAIHPRPYLDFLSTAHDQWLEAGRTGDAVPYAWPVVRRRIMPFDRIDAKLGLFSFDATSPIGPDTWSSAYWSAQTALAALESLGDARSAFAFCRPPGHHCGADYLGGYCYLNNAAIAAEAAHRRGHKVAILDIDYHHGNGTQDIFYDRGDIFFASIHADPRTDYPYYWGHADEAGAGGGEGATLNIPLPRGTGIKDYLPALDRALDRIALHAPDLLVCSFGADTFAQDPICAFGTGTADFPEIARPIASAAPRVLVVMEGGYAVDQLGENVAAFLSAF